MTAVLQKWGNSQGVRLPKKTIDDLALKIGDTVEIIEGEGRLVLMPIRKKRKHDINELVRKIPADYEQSEDGFGTPRGMEEW